MCFKDLSLIDDKKCHTYITLIKSTTDHKKLQHQTTQKVCRNCIKEQDIQVRLGQSVDTPGEATTGHHT